MEFHAPLVDAVLVQRYKRFLADVTLPSGEIATAHVANSGAMMGLTAPGNAVWLAPARNPAAKLPYSLEVVVADLPGGRQAVGVNTANPNRLAPEAIAAGLVGDLHRYGERRREVPYGGDSRVDLLLENPGEPPCFVEVKNVHLCRNKGLAEFPDSVTTRGTKHLAALAREVAAGARAVMLYVIQMDAEALAFAGDIDAAYARGFRAARDAGVEAHAVACAVERHGITPLRAVPILLP